MSLQEIAELALVIQAGALSASVLLLIHELRINNRLVRAANTQALVSLSSPFNLALIQDRKMAEFFAHGASHLEQMDDVDRYRYRTMLIWWLIFHENVFHQWRQGLLANHSFQAWAADLRQFMVQQSLWLRWDDMKEPFEKAFVVYVEEVMRECRPSEKPHLVKAPEATA